MREPIIIIKYDKNGITMEAQCLKSEKDLMKLNLSAMGYHVHEREVISYGGRVCIA